MRVNDEKKTLVKFSAPSDQEHKAVKAGLFWVAGPILYLRFAYKVLLYIALHASLVNLHIMGEPLFFSAEWAVIVLLILSAVSIVFVNMRAKEEIYALEDSLTRDFHVQRAINFFLDFTLITMSLLFSLNIVYMIIYFVVAVIAVCRMIIMILAFYRFEILLSRAIGSRKYELIGAEIMRKKVVKKWGWDDDYHLINTRHGFIFVVMWLRVCFHYLDVHADNGLDYTVEMRGSTYRSVKERISGYLLSFHGEFYKGEDTPMMYFCKAPQKEK